MPSRKPTHDGSLGNGASEGPNVGTPYGKSLKKRGYLWVFVIPKNPYREHNQYHGYTYAIGVHPVSCLETHDRSMGMVI